MKVKDFREYAQRQRQPDDFVHKGATRLAPTTDGVLGSNDPGRPRYNDLLRRSTPRPAMALGGVPTAA
jgi:hypothetical protein